MSASPPLPDRRPVAAVQPTSGVILAGADDASAPARGLAGTHGKAGAVSGPRPTSATTVTLGIDLASHAKNTGLCAIRWAREHAHVVALCRGADQDGNTLDDALIISAMHGRWGELPAPTKVAIDAPLGWPADFVRAVGGAAPWPVGLDGDGTRLQRRATDRWVHEHAKKLPLSVTTERIAYAAMRAAGLLGHYAATFDEAIDRSGVAGLVCETYPDPAIRRLGLWPPDVGARDSYKGDAHALREDIVRLLADRAPWLQLSPEHHQACIESDDCLDALICALVARAVERGLTVEPPVEAADEARSEGWIHLPAEDFVWANLRDGP